MRWIPLAMVVAGNVVYHLGQKMVPRAAHPLAATLGMYLVALVATLLVVPFASPLPGRAGMAAAVHWSVALVGVGIVAIEVGFLLAYRWGWEISSAALSASTLIALVLLPIGVFVFREGWSPTRLLGLTLCVTGLWLVHRR